MICDNCGKQTQTINMIKIKGGYYACSDQCEKDLKQLQREIEKSTTD